MIRARGGRDSLGAATNRRTQRTRSSKLISNPIVLSVITTMVLAGMAAVDRKAELEVVGAVDLSRYAGRWYEIARLPNRFEKKCADSVTATYTLRSDGKVDVVNRCRKANGKYTTATGKAKVVDKKRNAKLKVTFFWPFYGDYGFLTLDQTMNMRWSVRRIAIISGS